MNLNFETYDIVENTRPLLSICDQILVDSAEGHEENDDKDNVPTWETK
jgi:hypothetical protein